MSSRTTTSVSAVPATPATSNQSRHTRTGGLSPSGSIRIVGDLGDLLRAAQAVGAVRPGIGLVDAKALLQGCLACEHGGVDVDAWERMIAGIRAGLRA